MMQVILSSEPTGRTFFIGANTYIVWIIAHINAVVMEWAGDCIDNAEVYL